MDFRGGSYLLKIIVVGDLSAGKTCLIRRYVHDQFTETLRATTGVDFALKVLQWDDRTCVRLQLWDIAGQEMYTNLTRVYYKGAKAGIVVFDVTENDWMEPTLKWKGDMDAKVFVDDSTKDTPIPCLLLANKIDVRPDWEVENKSVMDEFCKKHNFIGWFATSAKEDIKVASSMAELVKHVLSHYGSLCRTDEDEEVDEDIVDIRPAPPTPPSNNNPCC